MQETASFVSRLVKHRPQLSSSTPPNKSFICILKLIHNLNQEEIFTLASQQRTHVPDFLPAVCRWIYTFRFISTISQKAILLLIVKWVVKKSSGNNYN